MRTNILAVGLLTLGGIGLGVALMVVDELFTIMSLMNWTVGQTIYYWPVTIPYLMSSNAASVWTAWEVAFGIIIIAVLFMMIGVVKLRNRR